MGEVFASPPAPLPLGRGEDVRGVVLDGRRAGKTRVRLQAVEDGQATARIDLDYGGQPLEAMLDRNRLAALNLSVGAWCAVRFHRLRVFPESQARSLPATDADLAAALPRFTNGSGAETSDVFAARRSEAGIPRDAVLQGVGARANGHGAD